jgi:hypothetical protein
VSFIFGIVVGTGLGAVIWEYRGTVIKQWILDKLKKG